MDIEGKFFLEEYHDPDCGRPKGRGRPKRGWVKVEATFSDGPDGRWYCGWNCVKELAERHLSE
jgi:hypothetical protein